VLSFPLTDNIVLNDYQSAPYARGLVRDDEAIRSRTDACITEFDVRTPSSDVPAGTLSGGNQQKLVVAREFGRDLRLLVLDQPTRGLDVGSVEFIHAETVKRRTAGTAILLISAELDEVLELSDRIGVIYRGELVAVVDGPSADKEEIGLLMATGGKISPDATRDMAAELEGAS
jgi:simple sugar transport system ATP-binding protein